jgi:hypothetical protein
MLPTKEHSDGTLNRTQHTVSSIQALPSSQVKMPKNH